MNKVRLVVAMLLCVFGTFFADGQEVKNMLETLNKEGKIALYINFETSKAEINSESKGVIDQVAEMMQLDKTLKISIEGHTDNAGNPKTNKKLSEDRAAAVKNALIEKGIDKTRLASKGWGAAKPIADNNTEDAKARNRRVEIVKVK